MSKRRLLFLLKYYLKEALATPLLGRPIRKAIWLMLQFSAFLHRWAGYLYQKHPYVRRLTYAEKPGVLPKENLSAILSGAVSLDNPFQKYYKNLSNALQSYPSRPLISILVPLYKVETTYLKEMLASIGLQAYDNWELCIVDDASHCAENITVIEAFQAKFPGKVTLAANDRNQHICATSNKCLSLAKGAFVALLDHDDLLMPNALAEMVRFINLHSPQEPDILFSDEATIDKSGNQIHAYHKPGWSPLLHLTVNYSTHLSLYRRSLLEKIGGFREGFEGAQDHDLMLRATEAATGGIVHVPLLLYQWRAHPNSTALDASAKSYAHVAGEKAVREACLRRGWPAEVSWDPATEYYRVVFSLKGKPRVSILVLSRDHPELLQPCLDSVFQKTTYDNFEVIVVDHNSTDPRTLALYQRYQATAPGRFRLIPFEGDFNFNKMNNLAASAAAGEYLVLLNNDTEIVTPNWLEILLGVAQQPQVGAVSAKLLFPNDTIQHAGLMGHGTDVACNAGRGEQRNSMIYFRYLQTMHEVLGVTAACLMVAKAKFEGVGGLLERYVPNAFGDVDFCLKLHQRNWVNVYIPYVTLYHKESATRLGNFEFFERLYMLHKWGAELLQDPFMNPNLLREPRFSINANYAGHTPTAKFLKAMYREFWEETP